MNDPRWRLEIVDEIGSTSDAVAARARDGEPAGLALMARRQTAARGSRGRGWAEPPCGNLAVTVLRRPGVASRRVSTDTVFVAAVAVHDALAPELGPGERLVLKWPNDLMIERDAARSGKVGGILVEAAVGGAGRTEWVTIGIGVNLRAAPDGVAGAATLSSPPRIPPAPELVARRMLDALGRWEAVAAADGFDAIRTAWLARAHPVGAALSVSAPDRATRAGRFAGIDGRGALLLDTGGSIEAIGTGAVLFGDAAEALACSS